MREKKGPSSMLDDVFFFFFLKCYIEITTVRGIV